MFSLSHLLREAERTLEKRRDTYPRLVVEGRMSDRTAQLRLDQQAAIVDALFVLVATGHFGINTAISDRIAARMERRRDLGPAGAMPPVYPRFSKEK